MSKRWQTNERVSLLLYGLLVYCFALPMPRLLVHSHASAVEHGAASSALEQHLKFYHAGRAGKVDFFTVHYHWSFTPSQDQLPSNAPHDVGIISTSEMSAVIDSDADIESPSFFLPSHCCPKSDSIRGHVGLRSLTFSSALKRVQLGVWNC